MNIALIKFRARRQRGEGRGARARGRGNGGGGDEKNECCGLAAKKAENPGRTCMTEL